MIKEIVDLYDSKANFCKEVGIKPQYLSQILSGKRPIPPSLANVLNQIHGANLHAMRPDIYPKVDQDARTKN